MGGGTDVFQTVKREVTTLTDRLVSVMVAV
jgi:hypothetical protein